MKSESKKKLQRIWIAISVLVVLCWVFVVLRAVPIAKQASLVNTSMGRRQSQDLLNKNPNDPVALRGMAFHFSQRREFPKAITYLRQAVKFESDNPYNKSQLAMTLIRAAQPDEARLIYQGLLPSTDKDERENARIILEKLKRDPKWGYFEYKSRATSPAAANR